ncbi:MAG: hypothetical protein KKF89_01400, partial [Nanoarchaeota archaeon]|nr:hypothetical protein [Nanoarchaeota archaeon]
SCVHAADRRFDNGWSGLVDALGFDYSSYRIRKKWDSEKVFLEFDKLVEKGEPLNPGYISNKHSDLMHAADRHCRGWDDVLIKKGLNPDDVKLTTTSLSNEELELEVDQLFKKGQDLSHKGMVVEGNSHTKHIYFSVSSRFDSWKKFLESRGIDYESFRHVRSKYSLDELVSGLLKIKEEGNGLSIPEIKKHPDGKRIHRAALRRFDSWYYFLDFCKVDPKPYVFKTNWHEGNGVLGYLQEHFDTGVVTGATRDRNFAAAVRSYYSSIEDAVDSADMIYSKSGRLTREMVNTPKNMVIFYKYNKDFLFDIVGLAALDTHTSLDESYENSLVRDVFNLFLRLLPRKPPKSGIREFCFKPIYDSTVDLITSK